MKPKTTSIEVEGQTIIVYYLMTLAEAKEKLQDERGPVASGMERLHLKNARRAQDAGSEEHERVFMNEFERWHKRADATWPQECRDLIVGLPSLNAFCVIPSSREERREPLRCALRAQFPNAIELTYTRSITSFGDADEDESFQALVRTDGATLPQDTRVGIVDDFAGNGATLRAFIRRIRADHRAPLTIVCAVPGVSGLPLNAQSRRTK